jgi:hypothetical protein
MRNIKLYEELNGKSDMMGFVFYIQITGRDVSTIGYLAIVANNFFDAAAIVIDEFTEGQDIENLAYCGYNELMDTIGEFGSPEMDNFDHDGWCGLKPRNNEPYSMWIDSRNPYIISARLNEIFTNSSEVFTKGKKLADHFDKCVIDSLIKSPYEIIRFSEHSDLPKILDSLPNRDKYEKLIRAKKSIKFT